MRSLQSRLKSSSLVTTSRSFPGPLCHSLQERRRSPLITYSMPPNSCSTDASLLILDLPDDEPGADGGVHTAWYSSRTDQEW